jgi:hypothetical protein
VNGATLEEVSATIADYERLAIGTGEWRGTEVSFSNDAASWSPYLPPTEDHPVPLLARGVVHREGVTVPTSVVIVWGESVPTEPEWADLWARKPHALFGAAVVRATLRRAFRDAIGDRAEPTESGPIAPSKRGAELTPSTRDWLAEIEAAQTPDAVNAIKADARAARAVTIPIEKALRARLAEVKAAQPAQVAEPAPVAEVAEHEPVEPEPVETPKPAAPAGRELAPEPETSMAAAIREALEELAANPPKPSPVKPVPQKPRAGRKRTKGGAA